MEITNKLQYQQALVKRAKLKFSVLSSENLFKLGEINNDIAEYEERQNQMPDLSFITAYIDSTPDEMEKVFETYNEKELMSYMLIAGLIPKIVKYLVDAAETDPEALELLQTIAKPLK